LAFIEKQKAEIEYLAKRSSDIRSDVLDSAESAARTFGVDLSNLTQETILQTTEDINKIIQDVATNGIQDSYNTLMAKITDVS
jgi:predicted Holliday junction resolvase-like endonuclease